MTNQDLSTRPIQMVAGEHDVQVRLLRAVETLLDTQEPSKELTDALTQLIDYTNVHFLSEQLLMRLYAYPLHEAHESRHTELLESLQEVRYELASGQMAAAGSLINRLRESIVDHIAAEDATFARYLADLDLADPARGET